MLQCSASTQSPLQSVAEMAIFSTKLNVLVARVQKSFKTLTLFVLQIFKSVITNFGYTLIRVRLPEIRMRKTVLVKKKKHSKSKLILTLISYSRAQLSSALACSMSSTHNRSNLCLEIPEFKKQERKWSSPPKKNKSLQKRPWPSPMDGYHHPLISTS